MSAIVRVGQSLTALQMQIMANQVFGATLGGVGVTPGGTAFVNLGSGVLFTKYSALTQVRVDFHVSFWINGAVPTAAEFAINFIVDYPVLWAHMDRGTSVRGWKGSAILSGIPAGLFNVQPRWRIASGAGSPIFDGACRFSFAVWEVQE